MFPGPTVLVLPASKALALVPSFSYLIFLIIHLLLIDNVLGIVLVSGSAESYANIP